MLFVVEAGVLREASYVGGEMYNWFVRYDSPQRRQWWCVETVMKYNSPQWKHVQLRDELYLTPVETPTRTTIQILSFRRKHLRTWYNSVYELFERSEFLIDTSQKKSLRVCTRAVCTCARVQ